MILRKIISSLKLSFFNIRGSSKILNYDDNIVINHVQFFLLSMLFPL
jgi:hypothetical protein